MSKTFKFVDVIAVRNEPRPKFQVRMQVYLILLEANAFIHSRISIAPLQLPYSSEMRSRLQHCKKTSFKMITECVGKRPR